MEEAITTAATAASTDFVSILTAVAPLAIGLVVGIAGVRLVIKLFNRAVGSKSPSAGEVWASSFCTFTFFGEVQ